jgi:steroid 5-alpha reductase family enzyme
MFLIPTLNLISNFIINTPQLFYNIIGQLALNTFFYIYSVAKNDISPCDYAWGLGYALHGFIYLYKASSIQWQQVLFSLLVIANGLRLTWYLARRRFKVYLTEDKRMTLIRAKVGRFFNFFAFFMWCIPQAFANFTMGLSVFAFDIAKGQNINYFKFILGISMMIFGLAIQTIADEQIFAFKKDFKNKGNLFTQGLFKYTRHPNYLGDIMFWWGVYIVNISANVYITFFAPLLLTFSVRFITGIPITEYFLQKDYKESFNDWKAKTPMLIPNFFMESNVKTNTQ